ncbi:uncharacterized protein LOC133355147 [Lethenteron reissneri]|uniref:uncharacterized protein LOC133355147 n=1 Tax=Lethenteron reissneri TaxID=7753 RepID=UPI002AB7052D|nr:uncharacterized protein LOC133355147 [Lethenteron reissneri]
MDITQRVKSSNLDRARQENRTFESRLRDSLEEIAHARCLALYAIARESTELLVENQQRGNEKFNLSLRRTLESAPAGQAATLTGTGRRRCRTSEGPWQTPNSFGVDVHGGREASEGGVARREKVKAVTFDKRTQKPCEVDRTAGRVGSRTTPGDGRVGNDRTMDVGKARRDRTLDAGEAKRDRTPAFRNDANSAKGLSRRKPTTRKEGGGQRNQDYRSPKRGGLKSRSGGPSPPSRRRIIRFCTLFSSSNSHRQEKQGLEEAKLKLRPPRRRPGLAAALGDKDEEQAVLLRLRRLSQARENAALEEKVRHFLGAGAMGDGPPLPPRKLPARRSSSVIPQDEDERLLEMFKSFVLPRGSSVPRQTLRSL